MQRRIGGLIGAVWLASASAAAADCKINVYADLPLQPSTSRALVAGAVDHKPVVFIADTGAQVSSMPLPNAQTLALHLSGMNDLTSEGIGGRAKTGYGHFDLKLGSIDLPNEVMLVVAMGSLDHHAVGLIGRELLMQHDLELNWPGNDIKVVQPRGCTPAQLAYWNMPYSLTKLEGDGTGTPAIRITVLLNGRMTPALVDSGSPRSVVTPEAARAAGASVDAGTAAGAMGGVGGGGIAARVVRFDSFTIGDETIKNAKLTVADIWRHNKLEATGTRLGSHDHDIDQPLMLLGADFLRAHRVLVANSLGVMVFSYLGGPVFDTAPPHPDPAPAAAAPIPPPPPAA
ncbi:MAG: aspartyl protease family protein, partial [Caulobacteraceae bacterium]